MIFLLRQTRPLGLGPGGGWWARRGVAHVLAAAGEERSSVRRCRGRFPGLGAHGLLGLL